MKKIGSILSVLTLVVGFNAKSLAAVEEHKATTTFKYYDLTEGDMKITPLEAVSKYCREGHAENLKQIGTYETGMQTNAEQWQEVTTFIAFEDIVYKTVYINDESIPDEVTISFRVLCNY